jgi:transcriptional regulator with XRE-family HTH domain
MKAEWFGPRLRELRERAGLTQQQLADACAPRMTREGVAQLETGRNRPAWATVIALCKALGVGADAFLEEPGELPPSRPGRPRKEKLSRETPKGKRKRKGAK